jgi:hypothetical protein
MSNHQELLSELNEINENIEVTENVIKSKEWLITYLAGPCILAGFVAFLAGDNSPVAILGTLFGCYHLYNFLKLSARLKDLNYKSESIQQKLEGMGHVYNQAS